MRVARRRGAQRLEDQQLLGRVGDVVLTANHMRDPRVEVVDRDREVVEHRAVGAGDHRVVHARVREADLAADEVVEDVWPSSGTCRRTAPGLRLAAEAAVGPVPLLVRPDVLGGRVGVIGVAVGQQLRQRLLMARCVATWEIGPSSQSRPSQREGVEDLRDVLLGGSLAVGIFDPQHECARTLSPSPGPCASSQL